MLMDTLNDNTVPCVAELTRAPPNKSSLAHTLVRGSRVQTIVQAQVFELDNYVTPFIGLGLRYSKTRKQAYYLYSIVSMDRSFMRLLRKPSW